MNICLNDNIFQVLSEVLTSEKKEGYVIGGYVRDCILKRDHPGKDIDILVIGNGINIARKVARKLGKGIKVSVFKNFGTAMFKAGDYGLNLSVPGKSRITVIRGNPLLRTAPWMMTRKEEISPSMPWR
jgi:poly(A) polymerase